MCCLWAGLIAMVLMFQRRFKSGFILFFGTALASLLVKILKVTFLRPRPPSSTIIDSYSFPSGHALSSMVFFGLMAWLLSLNRPSQKKSIHVLTALLTLWVGLSRIILGFPLAE